MTVECYRNAAASLNRADGRAAQTVRYTVPGSLPRVYSLLERTDNRDPHPPREYARGPIGQIVQPPETSITAPLMYDASSEASHA